MGVLIAFALLVLAGAVGGPWAFAAVAAALFVYTALGGH